MDGMRWSAMRLEAQNHRKTAHFIASCGRAYRAAVEYDQLWFESDFIVFLALDRFIYINFPLRYAVTVKRWHMVAMMIIGWGYSFIAASTILGLGITEDYSFVCHTRAISTMKTVVGDWKIDFFWLCIAIILWIPRAYSSTSTLAASHIYRQTLKVSQERVSIRPLWFFLNTCIHYNQLMHIYDSSKIVLFYYINIPIPTTHRK